MELSFKTVAIKSNMIERAFLKRLCFLLLIASCADSEIPDPPADKTDEGGELTVNLADERQTIHSFGGSDAWTTKFVGKWTDLNKRNQVADLLFSTDTMSNGSPKGIGLSLWRFNIGAGSYEQGVNSDITDEWRREECFQNADGSYDWNKHEGQRWFMQAAKERGVKYTMGFSISAPVHMTQNGKAFSPGGSSFNILGDKMDDFADFLVDVSKEMQFDYLSPVNEPQWGWTANNGKAGQEGSPAQNSELAAIAKLLSDGIAAKGANAKVVIAEAAQLDFLYGRNNDGRGDQINQFFSSSSGNYVGNVQHLEKAVSGHSYFTTCPDDNLIRIRQDVHSKAQLVDPSLQVWMTEFGVLGDICGKYNGWPLNRTIDYGLYVAKVIHHDLAVANVSSWQWWLSVSCYNYSDALVYVSAPDGSFKAPDFSDNPNFPKTDGIVLDSKQLWAFGNFSRFVRPGMVRVGATLKGKEDPVVAAGSAMVSAYKDPATKTLVVVIVNTSADDLKLNLTGVNVSRNRLKTYTTSGTKNLAKTSSGVEEVTVEKKSIVTLVGKYQ